MNNMARLTTVLVTTVGPYTSLARGPSQACVEEGTHYVDITGEAFWVQRCAINTARRRRRKESASSALPAMIACRSR